MLLSAAGLTGMSATSASLNRVATTATKRLRHSLIFSGSRASKRWPFLGGKKYGHYSLPVNRLAALADSSNTLVAHLDRVDGSLAGRTNEVKMGPDRGILTTYRKRGAGRRSSVHGERITIERTKVLASAKAARWGPGRLQGFCLR